jgi:hypothetical protein
MVHKDWEFMMCPFSKRRYNWILLAASCLLALQSTAPLYAQTATATVETTIPAEVATETPVSNPTEPSVELATATPLPEQTEVPIEATTATVLPEQTETPVELATATPLPEVTDAPIQPETPTPAVELPTATITATAIVEMLTVTPLPEETEAPVEPTPIETVAETLSVTATAIVEIPTATPLPEQTETPVQPATATPVMELPTATATPSEKLPTATALPVQTEAPLSRATATHLPEQTEVPAPLQLATVAPITELPTATVTGIAAIPTVTPTPTATAPLPTATAIAMLPTVTPTPNATVTSAPAALSSMDSVQQLVASIVQEPSFAVTLNGRDQVVDTTMTVLLSDTRTQNSGWNLQIAAIHIVEPSTGRMLRDTELTIPAVAVECVEQPCTLPFDTVRGGTVWIGPSTSEAVKFLNAGPGSGIGELMVTPTLRLHVPADAYADDYQITVVVTIVSGP